MSITRNRYEYYLTCKVAEVARGPDNLRLKKTGLVV